MIFFDDRTDVAVLFISGISEGEDISDTVPEAGYFEESLYIARLTVAHDEQRELLGEGFERFGDAGLGLRAVHEEIINFV